MHILEHDLFYEFDESLEMFDTALQLFSATSDPKELRYHWSAIVKHSDLSTKALISIATSSKQCRGLKHEIENRRKEDKLLNEEHPNDRSSNRGSRFINSSFDVGGAMSFAGGSYIKVEDVAIENHDGSSTIINAKIDMRSKDWKINLNASSPVKVSFNPEIFQLENVKDIQGKTHTVPKAGANAKEICLACAEKSLTFLKEFRQKIESIFSQV
jgi:hypothetical protein